MHAVLVVDHAFINGGQAKVALDEARTADGKGDAKGCMAALERAKQQLNAAP